MSNSNIGNLWTGTSSPDILYENVSNNPPLKNILNGRVIGLDNQNKQFNMFNHNNNNSDIAKDTILQGTISRTKLSETFFSNDNMKKIQNMLKTEVYNISNGKYKIGNQDNTHLQVIMRAVYLQNAKHLPYQIEKQVDDLNNIIVQLCLPDIMSGIKQYIHYIHSIQRLPNPIELPRNLSSKGTKILSSVTSTF